MFAYEYFSYQVLCLPLFDKKQLLLYLLDNEYNLDIALLVP